MGKKVFKLRKILVILFFMSIISCGKKGPLKPPIIQLPGVKDASFSVVEDRILIRAILDSDVDFFKIERVENDEMVKSMQSKVIYEGVEKNIYFIDKNLDIQKTYQYKIIPFLKNKKIGKVYVSMPISFNIVKPPYNLTYEVIETSGTVTLYFEGSHCDSFNIYRYKKGDSKPQRPYANSIKSYFVDDTPITGMEMVYEVSCIKNTKESINNPSVVVIIK